MLSIRIIDRHKDKTSENRIHLTPYNCIVQNRNIQEVKQTCQEGFVFSKFLIK